MSHTILVAIGASLLFIAGCDGALPSSSRFATLEARAEPSSPLGPSFVLLAQPTDDDGLLGSVVKVPVDDTHPIEDALAPNPCLDKLEAPKTAGTLNAFEDAQDLGIGASARATLGRFGFEGDTARATHLLYKVSTEKRITRQPTAEYAACCKDKGCGAGYVSMIVFGDGEYSSAAETDMSGHVDIAVASAGGATALKTLHKKKVRGYIAAVVTTGDFSLPAPAPAAAPAPKADDSAAAAQHMTEQARREYLQARIDVCARPDLRGKYIGADVTPFSFCTTGVAGQEFLTENEFVRRYRATTGFHDLDEHETDRFPPGKYAFFAGGALASGGLITVAVAKDDATRIVGATMGGMGALIGGVMGIEWLAFHEGDAYGKDGLHDNGPYDLSEHDAHLAAARHNRALARRLSRGGPVSYETTTPPIRLGALIGAGVLGLKGTF